MSKSEYHEHELVGAGRVETENWDALEDVSDVMVYGFGTQEAMGLQLLVQLEVAQYSATLP